MGKIIQICSSYNPTNRECDIFCVTDEGKAYEYGMYGWVELDNKPEKSKARNQTEEEIEVEDVPF